MSFLALWALVVGALAAAGAVVLHLVARQRPAAYLLPTTRFIPDRRTLVSRIAATPRDHLLLALRVLLLLSAAAAFARPVLSPSRAPRARIVLLDRSAAVASPEQAIARARALLAAGIPARLIAFDSAAASLPVASTALDSLSADTTRSEAIGSLGAALAAARRLAPLAAAEGDSVELVLVSPLAAQELDAATDSVRARWPGALALERVAARSDTSPGWTLERALDADDPLFPALAAVRTAAGAAAVRIRRALPGAADSAFARAGGTVLAWDAAVAARLAPTALAMGDDVVVATLGRLPLAARGRAIARWSDGTPAATEERLGAGCIRRVAVAVPLAGDLPLRPAFQRVVRGLAAPCGARPSLVPADSASVARLLGTGPIASGDALAGRERDASSPAKWLLGVALLCALAELALRRRSSPEAA
jgi:hypothetical protein